MTLPQHYGRFATTTLVLTIWLGYLAWLVAERRPEPILQTAGLTSWPSRAWLASTDAVLEIKETVSGMEIVTVFKSPANSWKAGQVLNEELATAMQNALTGLAPPTSQPSSWIIGLQSTNPPERKQEWKLANDPAVPGRKEGPPRIIPATPWARAWMPTGS